MNLFSVAIYTDSRDVLLSCLRSRHSTILCRLTPCKKVPAAYYRFVCKDPWACLLKVRARNCEHSVECYSGESSAVPGGAVPGGAVLHLQWL